MLQGVRSCRSLACNGRRVSGCSALVKTVSLFLGDGGTMVGEQAEK